jgi:hypothetical protein
MPYTPEQLTIYDNWLKEQTEQTMLALVDKGLSLTNPPEIEEFIDVVTNLRSGKESQFKECMSKIDITKQQELARKLVPIFNQRVRSQMFKGFNVKFG